MKRVKMKTLILCSVLAFLSGFTINKAMNTDEGAAIGFVGMVLLLIVAISIIVAAVEGFG